MMFRNADSPTEDEEGDGQVVFVKPCEEQQEFNELIDFITEQECSGATVESVPEVRYAQTRGSLH